MAQMTMQIMPALLILNIVFIVSMVVLPRRIADRAMGLVVPVALAWLAVGLSVFCGPDGSAPASHLWLCGVPAIVLASAALIAFVRFVAVAGGGFLHLLSRPDPSRGWPLRAPFEPVLDLRSWSLSGVAIGEAEAAIHRLGRPDNRRPRANGQYAYHKSGTRIGVVQGEVDNLIVVLRPVPYEPGLEGARGHLVGPRGHTMRLTDQTTLRHVTEFLGPPARKDEDAPDAKNAEIVYFYEYDGHGLDVEALPDGHVKCLSAYASGE